MEMGEIAKLGGSQYIIYEAYMHVCMKVGKGYKHAWLLFWGEFLLLSAINTELVCCTFLPQTLSLSMFAGEATPPLGASTGRLACLYTGSFDFTHTPASALSHLFTSGSRFLYVILSLGSGCTCVFVRRCLPQTWR